MRIAVVREIKSDEYRVALTPAGARELVQRGHEVLVEGGAGEGSAFPDGAYVAAGARVVTVEAAWARAELLLKVKEPRRVRVRQAARGTRPLHLPAPGRRPSQLTRALVQSRCRRRRVRDGRATRRSAPAARSDERGGRPAGRSDGRVDAGEIPGRARDPARRRAGRPARQGRRPRRRDRRLQRGPDCDRHAGRRLGARQVGSSGCATSR